MESAKHTIIQHNLIKQKDIVGVACSGGRDSMALLHFLNSIKNEFDFSIIAVNIDHCLRENSAKESQFVINYCNSLGIEVISRKINVLKICDDLMVGIEEGARIGRYGVFEELFKNGIINKLALGHHLQDQAETILQNIFRGSGTSGAKGMSFIKNNFYIRPFLSTNRTEIQAYVMKNDIPYVDDESNFNNEYSRNYIRNMILPIIRNRWPNADANICSFGELCTMDDNFINSLAENEPILTENGIVKIQINSFINHSSIISRLIRNALNKINIFEDIEKKHIQLIKNLAMFGNNGKKLTLPNNLVVYKEYNFIVFSNKTYKPETEKWQLERGIKNIKNFGVLETFVTRKLNINQATHIFDYNKVPKTAIWRFRENGDIFTKFGGGTKSLNDYFIDKKIPTRLRDITPILTDGNEVLIVANVEISDKIKLDEFTKTAWCVNVVRF